MGVGVATGVGVGTGVGLGVAMGDGVGVGCCEDVGDVGANNAAPGPQPPKTTVTRMATRPTTFTRATSATCDTRRLAGA
jgi:hypothetical protein